ncbi:Pyridoxal-dependent decarboxylase conserved domain-containing protein [Yoonia rosea]|uniref:Pyridoxal-dependent decarboxylase conserved domain-containing protein n=1 Tax=Yoonia rosea TaxID=287098 RepID=A0A1R3WZG7_9RHOB|nr:pyridoxal-dependent decarboxylase [Yoonia rosea]SIT83939.1 Pyridoxal-dependent decarboxylase conserved domain-containing protein [Yoonia rosea]
MERHQRNRHIVSTLSDFHAREKDEGRMDLDNSKGSTSLAGWFLGPLAENQEVLDRSITKAIAAHCDARREYGAQFRDPPFVTSEIKASDDYRKTIATLDTKLEDLLGALHGSIPLSSYRNQSHMYWDITMPGAIGYFAAMLYNQNNVAAEASPVTTLLEIEVGKDLARMLGYHVPSDAETAQGALTPWAHITCDGSVANGESMWAARNLKYMPITMAEAIRHEPDMAGGKDVKVKLADGRSVKLLDLDSWELLNVAIDDVIALSPRLQSDFGITPEAIKAALDKYSVQNLGLAEYQRRFIARDTQHLPVVLAPSTAHYSWPKSAALIGLGANQLWRIHVDEDGRMRMDHLRETLQDCLDNKRPILEVVAVIGSTEESAVDPLADIVELRDEFRRKGLEFSLHVDGAWGGYFASMLRDSKEPIDPDQGGALEQTPAMIMSDYVMRQYRAFPHADTQTVDPHKAGFIPYPAGALCYRNGAMRDMITFTAPVVYHGGVDPTVGVYGIEGSKPGAAAAGVYLSHAMIRPDKSGYGKLLGKCIFNSKRLYAELVSLDGTDDYIKVVPFQRLPCEKAGKGDHARAEEVAYIRENFVPRENNDLVEFMLNDQKALDLFKELGSDQNIVTYAVNFKTTDGWNTDVTLMNAVNTAIYKALSISTFNGGTVPKNPMFVTSSAFDVPSYGQSFVDAYGARAGLDHTQGTAISFLISTTQDPWVSATAEGNYLPQVVAAFKTAAKTAVNDVLRLHGLTHG